MKLYEYQTKAILSKFHVPLQHGELAETSQEVYDIVAQLHKPVIIKGQIHLPSHLRSKVVHRASSPQEAADIARDLFAEPVEGQVIQRVLVEPIVEFRDGLYIGIGQDRSVGKLVLVASTEGGVRIEETAFANPDTVSREDIDPLIGLRSYQVMRIASHLNVPRHLYRPLDKIVQGLYTCYMAHDAVSLELNPLAITYDDRLVALNARIIIDDNALFRHPELVNLLRVDVTDEMKAREMGLTYVPLDGQIGCVVNGAGLAMATMDMIHLYGDGKARPANFLDIGGGADAHKIKLALNMLSKHPQVNVVLVNIFGGMTRCDEVAEGILATHAEKSFQWPLVVRLQGNKATEGQQMLKDANIPGLQLAQTLTKATLLAVERIGVV